MRSTCSSERDDKLNHFSFDAPLSITDTPLYYLTGMIDIAEPSSDFKHTDGTKSRFIPALQEDFRHVSPQASFGAHCLTLLDSRGATRQPKSEHLKMNLTEQGNKLQLGLLQPGNVFIREQSDLSGGGWERRQVFFERIGQKMSTQGGLYCRDSAVIAESGFLITSVLSLKGLFSGQLFLDLPAIFLQGNHGHAAGRSNPPAWCGLQAKRLDKDCKNPTRPGDVIVSGGLFSLLLGILVINGRAAMR
ncbi:hypothetical protein JRQ81_009805 [Phrynocephalus forsythii]|uniref:Uncharacterized protein n=1 Tax=Phrynocephalus forsythii TaxID=171643 RepID=A0A9Q0X8W7_9SAUR|nr:hypothetical protein JRQ81_009805 [Phrynocephalus forsythii]